MDGQTITYDASGNPTSYYNGTRWTFGWSNGRQLTSASGGGKTLSFTYDGNGLRTSKTSNGVVHNYLYAGGKLLRETYGSNTLDFFYDASGNPYALKHNGTVYYYITNLQGDVMKLVNASGTAVATYDYDPYGNVITATGNLADVNPLRYRGYYYDLESSLYYCQSRYYDPEIGRFINADSYASTGQGILGNNMFAYCSNNPVNCVDSTGRCSCASTGKLKSDIGFAAMCPCGGGAGGGGGALLIPSLVEFFDAAAAGILYAVSYAYRQYTKSIKATTSELPPGNYPVTHHIIPYGKFSTRDPEVYSQLREAQEIMIQAGVNPETDPINQLVLSATYHLSLHTNSYIIMVTEPIVALGMNATKTQIYAVLDNLRFIIAANDQYAWGY